MTNTIDIHTLTTRPESAADKRARIDAAMREKFPDEVVDALMEAVHISEPVLVQAAPEPQPAQRQEVTVDATLHFSYGGGPEFDYWYVTFPGGSGSEPASCGGHDGAVSVARLHFGLGADAESTYMGGDRYLVEDGAGRRVVIQEDA